MRLDATDVICAAVARRLDARLDPHAARPLAVAFSGGGDSLALLLATQAWARQAGRRLIAITVDHRLNSRSATWTLACAERAKRLGIEHRALAWVGDKPTTGLSAAARAARHALVADTAREAGASVVLMGHTRDDVLEAKAMRAAGSTVPSPREWSPSPAWPQGRGVFLLRPMLALRRADLRDVLVKLGETWIEDPANADPASLRARVRHEALADRSNDDPAPPDLRDLFTAATIDRAGVVKIGRAALDRATVEEASAFLSAAILCAAGTSRPPRGESLRRLLSGSTETTLAGARVEVADDQVRLMRDPGRQSIEPLTLPPNQPNVFDGRFEITAPTAGWTLVAARGRQSTLPCDQRRALKAFPPPARQALPLALSDTGEAVCPVLDPDRWRLRNLAKLRLMAACGVIKNEATLSHVGETPCEPLNQRRLSEGLVHELA